MVTLVLTVEIVEFYKVARYPELYEFIFVNRFVVLAEAYEFLYYFSLKVTSNPFAFVELFVFVFPGLVFSVFPGLVFSVFLGLVVVFLLVIDFLTMTVVVFLKFSDRSCAYCCSCHLSLIH